MKRKSNKTPNLAKTYRRLFENRASSNDAELLRESNDSWMKLNGKSIDIGSIELDGVDRTDYPDMVDAYISYAEYTDGTELDSDELEELQDEYRDAVADMAREQVMGG